MVDPDRVRRLLQLLAGYGVQLDGYAQHTESEYMQHPGEAKYAVQCAAQCCINLANHVISSGGWRVPGSFKDSVTVLEEHRVLEADLADRLRDLVGLRNILVHLYAQVDDSFVRRAIIERRDDLKEFARAIAHLLDDDAT